MTNTTPHSPFFPTSAIGKAVKLAWEEQEQIGWIQVAQGRLSKKWGKAQGMYYYANPDLRGKKYYTALHWTKSMISALCDMSLAMWKNRCDSLHGRTKKEQLQKRRDKLKSKLEWCYRHQRLIPTQYHQMFQEIVHDGALRALGMVGFSDVLSREGVDAIHAFLIDEAHKDKALREQDEWWRNTKANIYEFVVTIIRKMMNSL